MYDHVGIHVTDLDASVRFYSAVLGALGLSLQSRDASGAGLGPADAPALWLYPSGKRSVGPVHVAFRAATRAEVDAFHRAGVESGGRDNGRPDIRADYSPTYYAAFLIDPDGNNVEAVCTSHP